MSQEIFAQIHSIFSLFFIFTLACNVQSKLNLTKVTSSSCDLYVCKHQYQLTQQSNMTLWSSWGQPSGKFHVATRRLLHKAAMWGKAHGTCKKKKKRKTDQNIATLFSLLEMCETLLRQLTSSKGRNQTGCEVGLFFWNSMTFANVLWHAACI